jgi:CubicO group peptidase (beta-lactamase class C family)
MKVVDKALPEASIVIFSIFCIVFLFFGLSCAAPPVSSSLFPYKATIAEGQAAAKDGMKETGASSVSIAFIDGERLVWAETFGLADRESKAAPDSDTMYCIGSTSKALAAIAVMKLVDQKKVSLDAPLVNYIKSFSMLSPEYRQVTVRMLLNHSTGFPGTDERNAETSSPLPFSFSGQVLETLRTQRLKHPPGYLSVYCNDCFTVVEQLVLAVTGKSYAQFMQDEIFAPLGMTNSRYPAYYFPEGSFAKRYDREGKALPQLFLNTHGSGGLYSTPTDMAKIAMMMIGKGRLGSVRILSEESVAAMGADQTVESFNPVRANGSRYGLGWDTVHQPGLVAFDVTGWQKRGDVPLYGAVLTILPSEKLAVVVLGASGSFGSRAATKMAERILLRALAEKGRIASMPVPLKLSVRPEKTPPDKLLDSVSGWYANSNSFLRVRRQAGSLNIERYDAGKNGWQNWMTGLKLRDNDRFASDADPSRQAYFKTAEGRQYLVFRSIEGYGHYQDDIINAQQVAVAGKLPGSWSGRLGKKWLLVNEHPDFLDKWGTPVMQLHAIDNFLIADWGGIQVVNPFFSDSRAGMMLLIPQVMGRDMNDVVVENRGGREWIRYGSYLFLPLESVSALSSKSSAVKISAEGQAEWRLLSITGRKKVTITPAAGGHWKIYDGSFKLIEAGKGTKIMKLSGGTYYLLFHDAAKVKTA